MISIPAPSGWAGFLRCVAALATATAAIDETEEAQRCAEFLRECDPAAPQAR